MEIKKKILVQVDDIAKNDYLYLNIKPSNKFTDVFHKLNIPHQYCFTETRIGI